jgi:hypothetical protein
MMSYLIIGIIVDVYGHVLIENFQCGRVGWVAATAWDFAILHAGKFIVLDPKVGLEYLKRCRESKQGCVSGCQGIRFAVRSGTSQ